MSRRLRWAVGVGLGLFGCGLALLLVFPTLLRWALLSEAPLAGGNDAELGATLEEREAFHADLLADRTARLTGPQVARLGGAPRPGSRVYELTIEEGSLRCRASLPVQGHWLNLDSTVGFVVENGRFTMARVHRLRIGPIDLGGAAAGWELAGRLNAQIERMAGEDPTVAPRVAVLERVSLDGPELVLVVGEGWDVLPPQALDGEPRRLP